MQHKTSSSPLSRRERKKRDTRNKILHAALSLFAERGYDHVRVEDIRERADVANATFFAYFPTKAALVKAFGDDLIERAQVRLAEYDAGAIESLELLRVIYFDEWAANIDLLRKIYAAPDSPEGLVIASAGEGLLKWVSEIVARGQEQGEILEEYSPDLIAHCLVGGWRAVMSNLVQSGDKRLATAGNRQILDIVLRGAAKK